MSNEARKVAFTKPLETDTRLNAAYAECKRIALGHYENFPVGSILIPSEIRPDFFALYAFMRQADDLADLPTRSSDQKLEALRNWRSLLEQSFSREIPDEQLPRTFLALRYTCRKHKLTPEPFRRLLDAFEFDARGEVSFATFDDLLWYCDRSANPVGELVLALFGYRDAERIVLSNSICSGLQLLNFCQDVKEDLDNGRLYFARSEIGGLPENSKSEWAASIVMMQLEHVRRLLLAGARLPEMVEGRLRYELRAVIWGGLALLKKLDMSRGNSYLTKPKLSKMEHLAILAKSLFARPGA